jgi:hypothetical protein
MIGIREAEEQGNRDAWCVRHYMKILLPSGYRPEVDNHRLHFTIESAKQGDGTARQALEKCIEHFRHHNEPLPAALFGYDQEKTRLPDKHTKPTTRTRAVDLAKAFFVWRVNEGLFPLPAQPDIALVGLDVSGYVDELIARDEHLTERALGEFVNSPSTEQRFPWLKERKDPERIVKRAYLGEKSYKQPQALHRREVVLEWLAAHCWRWLNTGLHLAHLAEQRAKV